MSADHPLILIIDDNPDYGGHQVMTAHALEGLMRLGKHHVQLWLDPHNHQIRQRFSQIQAEYPDRLQIADAPTRTRKFQAVRSYFEVGAYQRLVSQVRALQPDLLLVIQGNIEQGSSVFRLQGKIDCPLISYIPVPHKHAEMGAKLGFMRDLTCRHLYRQPDGFITISKTLAEMLFRLWS